MQLDQLAPLLRGIPYMTPEQGRRVYEFIRENRPSHCLELGFGHGVGSCYMAAALAANGRGRLTCVDIEAARDHFRPSIEELLDRTGLRPWVEVRRERTSYTWFLKKMIEERSAGAACEPLYDFCYIDGCKNWTVDGLAFFLVDKLLKQGGHILFDDFKWTYQRAEATYGQKATDGIVHRELDADERSIPHVELIFRLLVMQHPDYSFFRVEDDDWAWARKARASQRALEIDTRLSARAWAYKLAWPLRRLLRISPRLGR